MRCRKTFSYFRRVNSPLNLTSGEGPRRCPFGEGRPDRIEEWQIIYISFGGMKGCPESVLWYTAAVRYGLRIIVDHESGGRLVC
jgi:hypothetical protein